MVNILGIDPGDKISAYIVWNPKQQCIWMNQKGIVDNEILAHKLLTLDYTEAVLETMQPYLQPVGKTVLETCRWEGEFRRILKNIRKTYTPVYRKEIVSYFCGKSNVKNPDSKIRSAILERFGYEEKSKKVLVGPLQGVVYDIWQALALCLWYTDKNYLKKF